MKARIEEKDKEKGQKLSGASGWKGEQKGAPGKSDLRMDIFGNAAEYYITQSTPHIPNTGERLSNYPLYLRQNAVPAALVIEFLPVLGSNAFMKPNSTLKGVASRIWQSLRNHCTTAVNYQPGDVLVTLMQLYSYPMRLKQIFRRMQAAYLTDDARNLNNNRLYDILTPSGVPRAQAISNMQDYVNTYLDIQKYFNDFHVPDFFPIFHRWENLLGTFFSDIEPIEGQAFQYYLFDTTTQYQTRLGKPDEVEGWHMDPYQDPGDIEHALNAMQQEISNIYEDSTVNFILGDLKKTYEDVAEWQLELITLDMVQAGPKPVYDPEMLYALYNASVMEVDSPSLAVNPTSGVLEGKYDFAGDNKVKLEHQYIIKHPKLFNAMKADMTVDEFRKYTVWTMQQDTWDDVTKIQEPGPEILRSMTIWYNDFDNGTAFGDDNTLARVEDISNNIKLRTSATYTPESVCDILFAKAQMETFAWAPMPYYWKVNMSTPLDVPTGIVLQGVDAELEAPLMLDSKNLKVWHDTIRQSLWNTPFKIV